MSRLFNRHVVFAIWYLDSLVATAGGWLLLFQGYSLGWFFVALGFALVWFSMSLGEINRKRDRLEA